MKRRSFLAGIAAVVPAGAALAISGEDSLIPCNRLAFAPDEIRSTVALVTEKNGSSVWQSSWGGYVDTAKDLATAVPKFINEGRVVHESGRTYNYEDGVWKIREMSVFVCYSNMDDSYQFYKEEYRKKGGTSYDHIDFLKEPNLRPYFDCNVTWCIEDALYVSKGTSKFWTKI